MHDSSGIEKLGTPTVSIATTNFASLAASTARTHGLPGLGVVVIPHPLGGIVDDAIREKARAAIDDIVAKATRSSTEATKGAAASENLISVVGDAADVTLEFYRRGWTDGLPIVPPTEEAVREMLRGTDLAPDHVLGAMPPANGVITPRKVAVNAVMAGCRPTYMPVLIAAIEGLLEEGFDLTGVQTSTGPHSPLLFLNGPIRNEINLNCGSGALGPGWQANAAIGRAIRLVQNNIGGAKIGTTDMTTLGMGENFTYCLGENEEASPWAPYHVDHGFDAKDSTVSVMGAYGPETVSDHIGVQPEEILEVAADVAMNLSRFHNLMMSHFVARDCLLILAPEHAKSIATGGWSKADVQRWMVEHCVMPAEKLRRLRRPIDPASVVQTPQGEMVRRFVRPDAMKIIVAGGPGKHSAFVNSGHSKRIYTKKVVLPRQWQGLVEQYRE